MILVVIAACGSLFLPDDSLQSNEVFSRALLHGSGDGKVRVRAVTPPPLCDRNLYQRLEPGQGRAFTTSSPQSGQPYLVAYANSYGVNIPTKTDFK